ncbi:related to BDF1 - sporulation protein [Pseudozyma flocculosa]|uniref:Related to BDF1 - sporulation protein n=1 Tax=Pseudozyma flocculosa TaxID=84751 RepID=A0A5C3F605_9BASI|nr:related to BDF1 - sporulation protein [Pseudozyma flocculosa]
MSEHTSSSIVPPAQDLYAAPASASLYPPTNSVDQAHGSDVPRADASSSNGHGGSNGSSISAPASASFGTDLPAATSAQPPGPANGDGGIKREDGQQQQQQHAGGGVDEAAAGRAYPDGGPTGMEPPAKKARTDDASEGQGSGGQQDAPLEITPQQVKFAQNTIKSLKNRREALAFLRPVDPVAMGVPHYPQVIRNPMDLGTIDIKLALTAMVLKPNAKPSEKVKAAAEWKLDPSRDYYRNLRQFDADVRLVFSNCATFNGPDSPFTESARVLEAAHDKYMKDAPAASAPVAAGGAAPAAAGEARARRPSNPVPTIRRSSSDANGRPKREIHPPPSKDLPWANEPQGATSSVVRKAASRKAASRAGKLSAREEAHYAKVALEEIKFCTRVIDDLIKPTYQHLAWVFYEMPERNLDWSPAYYQLIKRPTALKVIQRNIRAGKYADAEEFDADMQLLFGNCFLFNPPDSDVYAMGKELKGIYEDKMKKKPAPPPLLPDYDDSDADEDEDAEGDDDDDGIDAEALERLTEQIAGLQSTLATLEGAKFQNHELIANTKQLLSSLQQTYASSGSTAAPKKAKAKAAASAGAKRKSAQQDGGPAPKKKGKSKTSAASPGGASAATAAAAAGPSADYVPSKKAKAAAAAQQKKKAAAGGASASSKKAGASKRGAGSDDDVRVVTYEQKEELAAKIQELSEERLDGAIRIINEDKPAGQADEEEIELDIDELSAKTLYKLYKYVVRPSKKAAAAAAAAAKKANGRSAPLDGRKRGTGGLKKKNLDEGEEAERIQRLQQQLEQFGNPEAAAGNAAATGMHDDLVHSDSSSDGESGSDSDSD